MSFFSPQTELGVVFHIGSSSVGAGLVRFSKREAPQVIFTARELIPYQENVDPERLLSDMVAALKRVNDRIAREGAPHLKFTEFGSLSARRVMYVFSSPWSITQTKIVSVSEAEPFTLSREQVDKIVATHEKMFEAELVGGSKAAEALSVIERRVVQIKLNGYEVAEPYGKTANSAEISLFMSLVPRTVLDRVRDVSLVTYHPRDTKAYSMPLATFSTIRDAFHGVNDFLFIDVGGELTDVAVVKGGLMLESASLPFGRNFVVRKAAKALATTPEQAVSLIRASEEGHADPSVADKLAPVLSQAAEEWMGALETALGKLSDTTSLPTDLYAVIGNDLVPFFMKTLSDGELSVTLVNPDKLRASVSFGKHAEKDPFIAIIAAFAAR
jgi:hypothetical protein